ncbi:MULTISPECIES: flavin reductase [unclassified Micromonospora]|uniref:flavin reductase n=1 Tax=unclassified Micromonospora TaxID=2617518 RepID=UPI001033E3B5|nr:flavin reductase [Verrucosispora sp. SN26_14.1]TBL27357.1 flavin reductase [Verrucosispora sp. SN26_14.1]
MSAPGHPHPAPRGPGLVTARYRPHVAARPSWRCRVCGARWPCSAARLALLGEYRENRTGLLVYLGSMMYDAADDLAGTCPPETLAARFLTWARPR